VTVTLEGAFGATVSTLKLNAGEAGPVLPAPSVARVVI